VTPFNQYSVTEDTVAEVTFPQDDPLSVDLTMFPELPTPTKVLFPKVTPLRVFAVGEVALSQDEALAVDLKMLPEPPTPTNVWFPTLTP